MVPAGGAVPGGKGFVASILPRNSVAPGIVREQLPVFEKLLRDILLLDDMRDIGVAEDAATREVRAAGPYGYRLAVAKLHNELVMRDHRFGRLALGADRVEAHCSDCLAAGLARKVVLTLLASVVAHPYVDAAIDCGFHNLEERHVVEFVGGNEKRVAIGVGALDVVAHGLEQSAGKPGEGSAIGYHVGLAVAETPDVFLRGSYPAVEIDVVITAFRTLGGHLKADFGKSG